MADSCTLTFRNIAIEDLLTQSANSGTITQISQTVLGVGSIPLSPLVIAASDAAASALGVGIGFIYVSNAASPLLQLKMRQT